ncbi:MAG TPA: choline/ethanolamine kinase family protein [bacterium]|nr:choline/ethanolamine kinase family protein [bacterium]
MSSLPGGITNLNYRVEADGEAYAMRISLEGAELLGIDRRREYQCMLTASRTGVAPEVVYARPREGLLVTRFVPGRSLVPGRAVRGGVRRRVVRAMRRYHSGPPFAGRFSPSRTLESYLLAARRGGSPLPGDADRLFERVSAIAAILRRSQAALRPCHNDLWGRNLIDDGKRVVIVDWEYAAMGDLFFDLANFAIYHCPTNAAEGALLSAYFGRAYSGTLARLKLMKIVAELREALWYLVSLQLPTGRRRASAALAAEHFRRCRRALAHPHLSDWLEAP